MVEVNLWSGLRRFTGGEQVVSVEASTIGEMLDALKRAHPGLEPFLEDGVTVAVDGEVITAQHNAPIKPDSEVFLMQRLKGG
ncbi:MoaD/ThiS family protein [Seohaeicola nanhaiensis]|uniref:MoaD/ThiS family protein n=1 Tax=Seohaeicola nanhaiensis TaxID=1387282 RepID=A0ABV9KAY6_9RHOB